MASTKPRYLQFNSLERIRSSDANNSVSLSHAAMLALGAAVLQGDQSIYGVVRGLTCSANGADLRVAVAPGLALRSGTAATSYDSDVSWIELTATSSVDLASFVDGGNPRWVVIEISDGDTPEAQQLLSFWDPSTQSASSTLADKIVRPEPVVSVRAGTAAANPVFPSGISGTIPLAYVYIEAGAVLLNVSDIVMCRPMLRSDTGGDQAAPQSDVYGGGVTVAAAGTSLSLANAGGRFQNHRVRWGISAADGSSAFTLTAEGTDGASLPGVDDVLYLYACPPPYPSGHDANLAPREFRPGATALTRFQGMVCPDLYNAVIVVSTVEPQVGTQHGSPTAGNFTMTCAPFQAAATIDRTECSYIGACFWDQSAGDVLEQAAYGPRVIPNPTGSGQRPVIDLRAGGAFVATGTINVWTGAGTPTFVFPVTARQVELSLEEEHNTGVTLTAVAIAGQESYDAGVGGPKVGYEFGYSGSGNVNRWFQWTVTTDSSGQIELVVNTGSAAADINIRNLWSTAYHDAVLAMR